MENKHDFSFPVSWNGYILCFKANLPQSHNNILSLKEGSYRYFLYFCASIRVICNLVIVIRYYVR